MDIVLIAAAMIAATGQQPSGGGQAALTPGTVSIEVTDEQHTHPALDQMVADTVGNAFNHANFLVLPGAGHGRYIARVTVTQDVRGTVATSRPSSGVDLGGGRLGVALPTRGTQLSGMAVTRLDLDLVAREGGESVWHGSASTAQVQDSAAGAPAAVIEKLANAVIARFPERMDGTIAVP